MNDSLPNIRKRVDGLLADYELAKRQSLVEQNKLVEVRSQTVVIGQAQELAQVVAQRVQQQAHKQIAEVVSRCLEAVFDEPYTFKIVFERKRGRTEASLVFERDGQIVDPITASGGGVVDVASFALRLSCLLLSRPRVRRLLVLDEPFKFVSTEYQSRVKALLEILCQEMDLQILIVTHIEKLVTGTKVLL